MRHAGCRDPSSYRWSPPGEPKGKSLGGVWMFPNVKSDRVEKTTHPCQLRVRQ